MGTVYEAEQESPKRKVAVKVVRGGQFVEADTLARLKHPNIGGIYESGRTEDGQHFFAMELVRGQTLDEYTSSRPSVADPHDAQITFNTDEAAPPVPPPSALLRRAGVRGCRRLA